MSGRRRRARSRARSNRTFPQDCYGQVEGNLDDRPAFDATPFDPNVDGSAWDTLPTESIFDSTDSSRRVASPNDWLSSPGNNEMVPCMTSSPKNMALRGRRGAAAATPLLRRVLDRSNAPGISPLNSTIASSSGRSRMSSSRPSESCASSPFSSWANSTRASGLDSSGRSPGLSGFSQFADSSNSDGSHYSRFDDDYDNDDSYDEYNMPATVRRILSEPLPQLPIVVDTSPLPPWKPYRASERLEDPNNPPPMFHPMFANEWRTDPNISEEIRNMYATSGSEYSGNNCIFDYGQLSEFNTQNVYDPERFEGLNEQGGASPATMYADGTEHFGDPLEVLGQPTDDVPDKYRKQKWHYFELKKRLELFKQLGMETDLAMYGGQLERMEADPWTGDDSGRDVQVYMRGMEGDPALDDELLEQMEALVAPENEGRRAFYAAMENPPPIRDELAASPDCEMPPTTADEEQRAVLTTMENVQLDAAEDSVFNDSFETCIEGDAAQMGDTDFDESFHSCVEGDDSQRDDLLNTTFSLPGTNLNTSFTLPQGASVDFPPGTGPDSC